MSTSAQRFRSPWVALACIVWLAVPLTASSQPERIRPGHSYYADALAEPTHRGLVRASGPEKNYEEVYQFYRYYEFVYDEARRVVLFREYRRGEPVRSERYRYDDSGALVRRVVSQPGQPDEVTDVDPGGSEPSPAPRGD